MPCPCNSLDADVPRTSHACPSIPFGQRGGRAGGRPPACLQARETPSRTSKRHLAVSSDVSGVGPELPLPLSPWDTGIAPKDSDTRPQGVHATEAPRDTDLLVSLEWHPLPTLGVGDGCLLLEHHRHIRPTRDVQLSEQAYGGSARRQQGRANGRRQTANGANGRLHGVYGKRHAIDGRTLAPATMLSGNQTTQGRSIMWAELQRIVSIRRDA